MSKRSSINALPPEVRASLDRRLAEESHSYQSVSEWLAGQGYQVSVDTVWRYDRRQKVEREKVRTGVQFALELARQTDESEQEVMTAALTLLQRRLVEVLAALTEQPLAHPGEQLDLLARASATLMASIRASAELRQLYPQPETECATSGRTMDEIIQMIRGAYGV